jgi:glutathione S-transferase
MCCGRESARPTDPFPYSPMMQTLYIANKNYSSWSLRPWVLMRVLGIPFEEQLVPFVSADQASPFFGFSPTGKVPCLVEANGATIWDSLAITEYLAEHHPGVWPEASVARHWARSASAEMHSGFGTLRKICTMNCGVRVQLPGITKELQGDLDRIEQLWIEGLGQFGGPFLTGSAFTAVDAFFCPVAFRIQTYGLKLSPRAMNYATTLLELPAMQRWYSEALNEIWRDEAHEVDMRQTGTLLRDLRGAVA